MIAAGLFVIAAVLALSEGDKERERLNSSNAQGANMVGYVCIAVAVLCAFKVLT